MSTTEHDTDDDETVCPACEGDGEAHDHVCGYTNEGCPSRCSTEHEVDETCVMRCPETADYWRYCSWCEWEEVGRYDNDPYFVNGEYLCDPYNHGYSPCDECGTLVDQDDIRYSESHDCYYCERCYSDHGGGYGSPGQGTTYCSDCKSHDLNLDLLTEEFLCDCDAVRRHLDGRVVDFADEALRPSTRTMRGAA